jgi:hypothetical protein
METTMHHVTEAEREDARRDAPRPLSRRHAFDPTCGCDECEPETDDTGDESDDEKEEREFLRRVAEFALTEGTEIQRRASNDPEGDSWHLSDTLGNGVTGKTRRGAFKWLFAFQDGPARRAARAAAVGSSSVETDTK